MDKEELRQTIIEIVDRLEEELKALKEIQNTMIREMNARFEALEKRFTFMEWFMGIGFTALVVLMSLYKFLG